jgi:hypothetical protein
MEPETASKTILIKVPAPVGIMLPLKTLATRYVTDPVGAIAPLNDWLTDRISAPVEVIDPLRKWDTDLIRLPVGVMEPLNDRIKSRLFVSTPAVVIDPLSSLLG